MIFKLDRTVLGNKLISLNLYFPSFVLYVHGHILKGKQERKEEIMKELTETNGKIKEKADEAILRINKENKKGMGI